MTRLDRARDSSDRRISGEAAKGQVVEILSHGMRASSLDEGLGGAPIERGDRLRPIPRHRLGLAPSPAANAADNFQHLGHPHLRPRRPASIGFRNRGETKASRFGKLAFGHAKRVRHTADIHYAALVHKARNETRIGHWSPYSASRLRLHAANLTCPSYSCSLDNIPVFSSHVYYPVPNSVNIWDIVGESQLIGDLAGEFSGPCHAASRRSLNAQSRSASFGSIEWEAASDGMHSAVSCLGSSSSGEMSLSLR